MSDKAATSRTTHQMRQVSAGYLSANAGFRLFVEGPYGQREIALLIRSLEITRDALRMPECGPLISDGWPL